MNNVSRLLEQVKRPQQAKRKPSNFALYWAWLFYNATALLFDVIAAGTVYAMTGKFTYAALTFAAGFLPLLMHEFLFTRAYASGPQKVLAVIGAGLSVVTILGVGILAGLINVSGFTAQNSAMVEIAMIITLVLVAGAHGLIAAVYFYIDDGIKANQVRAESVAYHERRMEDIQRAKDILALAEQGAKDEDELSARYGGVEVLNEILGQLRGDVIASQIGAVAKSANVQMQEGVPVWHEWFQASQNSGSRVPESVLYQSAASGPLAGVGEGKG
jgi:hypothetical protein